MDSYIGHSPFRGVVDPEELPRPEAQGAGQQAGGELRDRRVQVPHHGVVVAARVLQVVLDVGERALEPGKARGGLEVGVGLGDGEDAAQRLAQGVLLAKPRGGPGGLESPAAGRDQRLQRLPFVAGVALHYRHH